MAETTKSRLSAFAARRKSFEKALAATEAAPQCFLLANPFSVRYLSGFRGEDSVLLYNDNEYTLISDSRFELQAAKDCPDIGLFLRRGPLSEAICEVLGGKKALGKGTLAVEKSGTPLALFEQLAQRLGRRKVIASDSPVDKLRLTKDASEIKTIRKAVRTAQKAFKQLTADGADGLIGCSEADLAGRLEYFMRQNGAEAASFATIVAAGANAALPHHKPGSRKIKPNQAVLFDWGAIVDGYCSDLTRVVFTGTIPPLIREIYEVVLQAQKKAIAAIAVGVDLQAVDAAARDYIAAAGYGERFGHGLGHGIGLYIHEGPTVSARSCGSLRAGNVITVEPGIYLPGKGGVRIEDDVLVTSDGPLVLSGLPKGINSAVLS